MKSSWKEKLITFGILATAVLISIKLRILNPWHFVFKDWGVVFTGNDPWYYYRLIDNCVHNFPHRLWFDAYTYFPYGTYTHFGPFLVYLGSTLLLIFGANDPLEARAILSFIPAIGGILLLFAVYLLSRETFDKKTALLAVLALSVIPGQVLYRGSLGFNDHHIWEVFWMTLTLGTFLYSYNKIKDKEITKKKIKYLILPGVSFGFYLLTWAPGFITALILSSYLLIIFLFRKFLDVKFENLALLCIGTFLTAGLIYLPFAFHYPGFSTVYYSPFQLLILLICSAFSGACYYLDKLDKKGFFNNFSKFKYFSEALLVGLTLLGIVLANFLFPSFFRYVKSIVGVIHPTGGMLTVAEVQPFFQGNVWAKLIGNFGYLWILCFIGYFVASYKVFMKKDEKATLVLWWGILMLIALAGQSRFAYYYGAVCSIFSAVTFSEFLSVVKFRERLHEVLKKNWGIKNVAVIVASVLFISSILYKTYAIADLQSKYAGGGIPKQWYDALLWMRSNTPDPGLDYYAIYKPGILGKPYPYYPKTAYGVMSWWDYGHWITVIARRIPNANPFQQGIGNKYNGIPGAAPFFTAFNESYADEIANKLGVKYVISDIEMATGKFYAMATWAEGTLEKASLYYLWPSKQFGQTVYVPKFVYAFITNNGSLGFTEYASKIPVGSRLIGRLQVPGPLYFKTMEAKLHLLDTVGLKHYRLIYESDPPFGWYAITEMAYKYIYNKYFSRGELPVNITPSGYVKIFEYVKGARIVGRVNNTNVTDVILLTKIKTNKGRTFMYYQKAKVINGTFEFVVPYAQQTKYPVKAVTPYVVLIGNETKTISLSDEDVEEGKTIYLSK